MLLSEDLARARHEHELRDSDQQMRLSRLVAARRARRRAERSACIAREAAVQASVAQSSLL